MDRIEFRDRIVLTTLPHAAFDGWSMRALRAGVADAGLSPETALLLFPGGIRDVVRHWSSYGDRRMLEEMEKLDGASMRVRDRIAAAVRFRFEVNLTHREAVRRGLSFLAMPQNADLAARCAFDTVTAMWYAAGDTSADYNYYTKRALLAAVLSATVLYWLDDESEDYGDTWSFLDRRIDDVMKIPKLLSRLTDAIERLAPPLSPFGHRAGRGFRARGPI